MEMHARLVVAALRLALLGGIANRGQGEGNHMRGQLEEFAEVLHTAFDRVDAQPHCAKGQEPRLDENLLHCSGAVQLNHP